MSHGNRRSHRRLCSLNFKNVQPCARTECDPFEQPSRQVRTRAPEREEWGGWVATFADPDGNVLQLMQLP